MMNGRYGMDQLNRFIMYLTLALIIVNLFARIRILTWLTIVLLIIMYCRAFSRSFAKRQQENMKYLELKSKFTGGGGSIRTGMKDRKAAKEGKRVLICPYCKEKLRVPVGAGNIKIRCPHCKREFEERV
ncbi:MAG: hypothetical protein Q4A65_00725 [Bacillota bacterium]|nr:hypothetical protein [Bacillota bacterium]